MPLHVYAAAAENHSFGFQPEPLLDRVVASQFDFAAGTQNALPGKPEGTVENHRYLPCCSRKSSGACNGAIG
jgi:hypothetical protein